MKQFCDDKTNTVYFSSALKERYPYIFYPSKTNLEANGVKVNIINSGNLWLRDFMPLQINDDHYVRFQYKTVGYEKYPQLKVTDACWQMCAPTFEPSIILDGGNCVRGFGKAIITEKVVKDNKRFSRTKLIDTLERLLECEVILIPVEPGDTLGHSDGIVKFVNEKTIMINDYSSIFEKDKRFIGYDKRLRKIFEKHNFGVVTISYAYGEWDWDMKEEVFRRKYPLADDFNPGVGYYINFLQCKGIILAPMMGFKKDVEVIETLRRFYPTSNIIAIDCLDLSYEGGLMACCSWNIVTKKSGNCAVTR